jgi:ABC-2 type transport system ATP-binding protein
MVERLWAMSLTVADVPTRAWIRVAGTLSDLLGRRQVRLRLHQVGAEALARLASTGALTIQGDQYLIDRNTDTEPGRDAASTSAAIPDLIEDLISLGVRVHAVEPIRITLEDKLLELLRDPVGPA